MLRLTGAVGSAALVAGCGGPEGEGEGEGDGGGEDDADIPAEEGTGNGQEQEGNVGGANGEDDERGNGEDGEQDDGESDAPGASNTSDNDGGDDEE